MIINEDFFDSEELDNEVVSKNGSASDDSKDYRYCRYLMTACIPEEHLQDFSKEQFKNIMDRIVLVDYGVEYYEDRISLYFNHFFKTLNQYLHFLLTVYNAAGRMIDRWICELNNDNEEDSELTLFADLSVIVQRFTNPSELTYMDTIESMRILKQFVFILNEGESIFDEDDYAYIFNMCLKKNTRVAEKIFIKEYPKFSTQLNLKNTGTVWSSNERIQNMLDNSLHIDSNIVIKEISIIEVSFRDKSDYSFNVVAMNIDKPDFNDALSGFRHYKKLRQRLFFEIYPEQCSFYINHGEQEYAACYPVGQILEKDKQTKTLYYFRIVYSVDSLYNNYMGFGKFLLDKMSIE